MGRIPKILIQTSKERPENILFELPCDWEYKHFTDQDILDFFSEYPVEEFSNIDVLFKNLQNGANKACLFRLYHLYVKGGVFLDSDAALEVDINDILKDYSFVTVISGCEPHSVFNGFLCAEKEHPIIYEALKYLYFTSPKVFNKNYFLSCDNLYSLVTQKKWDRVKLLHEYQKGNRWETREEDGTVVLTHYPYTKFIPSSKKMRFHVPGIHYSATSKKWSKCAFTQQILNFCNVMTSMGHTVIHYGHPESEVACEHVTIEYPYHMDHYTNGEFNTAVTEEIKKRKRKGDFLLAFWGQGHKSICDAFQDLIIVEPSIGYSDPFAPYRVYTSYAHLHIHSEKAGAQMNCYHAVIPCSFDLRDFHTSETKEDYFMFIGRLNFDKGLDLAIDITKHIGAKLKVAGEGPLREWPDHVEYLGLVDVEQRTELLSKAKGTFVLTLYTEPFGCTLVESLLCGTPVITTDWGAPAEIVQHGVTGFRCRTYEHMIWAARHIDEIDTKTCVEIARKNYSMEKVGMMYEEYFRSVYDVVFRDGFYQINEKRTNLDWLKKQTC